MGSTIGLYFDLSQQGTNELRTRLNKLASRLGYSARRGATCGEGNLAAMLQGIDSGDCEVIRRRCWASDDDDLFDAVIGWASIYPPADAASAAALAAVPEPYRAAIEAAYNGDGISLKGRRPGVGLSYGRMADRWTVDLTDDWSVGFGAALARHAGISDEDWRDSDELREAAYNFALDIATATDQALVARLGDDPAYGEGTRWGIDEESGRAWYAAH